MPPDPPRGLRLLLSFRKTVSIYPRRRSQWGDSFYGYRLKFWLFYGFPVKVNDKVKN